MSASWFVGVDVGGTFTDVVLADTNGEVIVDKLPTTPEDPRVGVIEGIRRVLAISGVEPGDVSRVVHGTTLATNVILEQKGGPIAFVVTEGFADLLRLGREARVEEDRYDLFFTTPTPPVEPRLTFEVSERVNSSGAVTRPLTGEHGRGARAARRRDQPHRGRDLLPQLVREPRSRARRRRGAARRAPRHVRRDVVGGVARAARVRAGDDHRDVRVRRAR